MIRFLIVLLGILVARLMWLQFTKRPTQPRVTGRRPRAEYGGKVVGCVRCALHVPQDRAVNRRGKTYCSPSCASAGPATG